MAKSIIAQNLKLIREVAGASRLKFSTFIGDVSPSIIQSLRIVIYMCTPTMEKDGDIPNLFEKLTILIIILTL